MTQSTPAPYQLTQIIQYDETIIRTCLSIHINLDKSHLNPLLIISGEILDVGGDG